MRYVFAAFLTCTLATAQSTWIVDDDPNSGAAFADVQPAVLAAQPGDLILVRDGWYTGPLLITKGVRVVSSDGAVLSSAGTGAPDIVIQSVPPGQVAAVSGFERSTVRVQACHGTIVVDGVEGGHATQPARAVEVIASRDVRVRGRRLESVRSSRVECVQGIDIINATWLQSPPLVVRQQSRLHLVSRMLSGPPGEDQVCPLCGPAEDGMPAVDSVDSELLVGACTLQGGNGGLSGWGALQDGRGGAGIRASGGSVRVSHSIVVAGTGLGTSPAIELLAGATSFDPSPRIDPTLVAFGTRLPGTQLELRIRATPGDQLRLLTGAVPAVQPVQGSAIERLLVVDRDTVIGSSPPNGVFSGFLPILSSWSPGDLVYIQVVAVDPGGQERFSNSVPLVVRPLPFTLAGIGYRICDGTPNSTGFSGILVASGSNTAADNDVRLIANALPPGSATLFLTSEGFITPTAVGAGRLCIGAPTLGRYLRPGELQVADPSGDASLAIDLTFPPLPFGATMDPGETWYFQAWFRDTAGGVPTSNLTSAMAIELH